MRSFLFILYMFISCYALGQENKFYDYLNHFQNGCYPIRSDSLCLTFGKGNSISSEYVNCYIFDSQTYASKSQYQYFYGAKLICNNYVLVLVLKYCDDYITRWGRGVRECFAIVYSMEGRKLSQSLIGSDSDGQCFRLDISSGENTIPPNAYTAFIFVYETTLLNFYDDEKQTYQGVEYVRVYKINRQGMIESSMQKYNKDVVVSKKNRFEVIEEKRTQQEIQIIAKKGGNQFYPIDIDRLNHAYKELINHPQSASAQKAYFEAFPKTWEEFMMTYQYFPDKEYDLSMFFRANNHLKAWYNLTTIPDSIYCSKLIRIAIGGRLHSMDAAQEIYGLKPLLKWAMKTRMDTMFSVLSGLRKGHQFEFWSFYWASNNYHEEINKEYEEMKKKNERLHAGEVAIMSDAYRYFHNGVNSVGNGFERRDSFSQE